MCFSKPYCGYFLACSCMSASRVCLAMMDAAAMESDKPSPFTMPRDEKGKCGTGRPSIKQCSTCRVYLLCRFSTALRMAKCVARRMLMRSITSASMTAYAQSTFLLEMSSSNNFSRFFAESFLESFSSRQTKSCGKITAAATTGPASGPRPASSMPQMI